MKKLMFIIPFIMCSMTLFNTTATAKDPKPKIGPLPVPPAETGWVQLFNGKNLAGWQNANCGPETWSVKQLKDGPVIHCTGLPTGVLHTTRHYENYVLELEWRHLRPGGNAGVFVWGDPVTAKGQPFTRGVEVQVLDGKNGSWYTTHGDIFPIHGAKMKPDNGRGSSRAYPTEHRSKPSPQWNHYRIVCNNGTISLAVNGKVVTTGANAQPRKGYLCLESEGSPVQFRKIRLRELPNSGTLKPNDIASYDEKFKIIYNGLDFRGLETKTPDNWKSANWQFHYTPNNKNNDPTLSTTATYTNYSMILDYRLNKQSNPKPFEIELRPGLKITLPGKADGIKEKQWQRVEITLNNNLLKVFLNGKILKYVTLNAPTSQAAKIGILPQGPLSFGNFYIKTLK